MNFQYLDQFDFNLLKMVYLLLLWIYNIWRVNNDGYQTLYFTYSIYLFN